MGELATLGHTRARGRGQAPARGAGRGCGGRRAARGRAAARGVGGGPVAGGRGACVGGREAGLSKWMARLPSALIWHSAKEAGLPSARSGHSANVFFLNLNPKPHYIFF